LAGYTFPIVATRVSPALIQDIPRAGLIGLDLRRAVGRARSDVGERNRAELAVWARIRNRILANPARTRRHFAPGNVARPTIGKLGSRRAHEASDTVHHTIADVASLPPTRAKQIATLELSALHLHAARDATANSAVRIAAAASITHF